MLFEHRSLQHDDHRKGDDDETRGLTLISSLSARTRIVALDPSASALICGRLRAASANVRRERAERMARRFKYHL